MSGDELILTHALDPAARAEWGAFLATAKRQHPRQDPRFAEVERAEGSRPLFARLMKGGRIRALALFSLRPHRLVPGAFVEASALSGPVADDAVDLCALLDALVSTPAFGRRVGRLRISPYWIRDAAAEAAALLAERGFRPTEAQSLRRTGLVPLAGGRETRLARLSKSARRELRRAERQGVSVAPVTDLGVAYEGLASLNRLRAARGLAPLSDAGFAAGFPLIHGPGDLGVMLAARHDGALVGTLMLYRSRDVAHGRHFAPEPERLRALSNLRISPLLWTAAMDWAEAHGCEALDVEGWWADAPSDDPRHGIHKYKSELGPEEIARVAEHYRPLNLALNAPDLALRRWRGAAGRFRRRLARGS